MLSSGVAYAAFVLVALLGPGLALLRLARVRIEPALVAPLGLAACAAAYWLSLVSGLAWLFPLLILALDGVALRGPWRRAEGPSLRGALPPLVALVAVFSLTEYGLNRHGPRGEFVFDNVVPEDTVFHAALAWELTVGTPPQAPGVSGVPMGYHLGLPLVRAAALRWAGVDPLDQLSRWEITLSAFAFVLALRAAARMLGAAGVGVALAGWSAVFTDFSFAFAAGRHEEAWLHLTDANMLFSLVHANSVVPALAMAVGLLVALSRHDAGEGRGWLALAAVLSFALPHFKAFMAAHALLGLGLAALLTRRLRDGALLCAPGLLGLALVVLGPASAQMQIALDPLAVGARLARALGFTVEGAASLVLWALAWALASLGLRIVGIGPGFRALPGPSTAASALAAMALAGWPIGLLFRVLPLDYHGFRPAYNEAWYFVEQSAPLLWVFTAVRIGPWVAAGLRGALAAVAGAVLVLPSTIQFVVAKRRVEAATVPPAIVASMAALKEASAPGDVVLMRPEPKRYPPPPLVLAGRRVPYTRYIPYLYQVAPHDRLVERLATVRAFFHTRDPAEARRIARGLGARYVCLFGDDAVEFPENGVLRPLYERANARVYEIVP